MNDQTKRRYELQELLEEILGSKQVHFQRPSNTQMSYPAILYDIAKVNNTYADNLAYLKMRAYTVIIIDHDPDSDISEKISELPYCRFDRHYRSNNLNHFVYTLYY